MQSPFSHFVVYPFRLRDSNDHSIGFDSKHHVFSTNSSHRPLLYITNSHIDPSLLRIHSVSVKRPNAIVFTHSFLLLFFLSSIKFDELHLFPHKSTLNDVYAPLFSSPCCCFFSNCACFFLDTLDACE